MKIITLRKKNIISFSASGILSLILAAGIFYNIHQRNTLQGKIDKIKEETLRIQNETSDLQSKTIELNKYKELWKKVTDNKKSTTGIKMDEINARMTSIAGKYSILTPIIKVTLPETLKNGIFDRSTINVLSSSVNLSFSASNDVKALSFITEFVSSLPGYVVITNLQLRKGKDYTNQDLVDISSGKSSGVINSSIDFFWYTFKGKELDTAKIISTETKPNSESSK